MKRLIQMAAVIIIAVSCGKSNLVSVADFSPTGEVNRLTTFKVRFNKKLAPADIIDKWRDEKYIEFEPEINGKFKWIDNSTLIFSPSEPLEPMQNYKAKVTNRIVFDSKYSIDEEEYKFNTPEFDAVKSEIFWKRIIGSDNKISVKANLYFNYPVSPQAAQKYLSAANNENENINFKIISNKSSKTIALSLNEISQTEKKQKIKITVKKGLQSIYGKNGLAENRVFEQELPPITGLAVTGTSSGFDNNNWWITVSTTQPVDEKRLKDFVKVEPARKLNFFSDENSFRLEGNFNGVNQVDLTVKKGLPGLYGGEMEFDYEQVVSFVDVKPSVKFTERKAKYLLLSGEKNIEFSSVNIPKIDIEVSKVFKNNLTFFLQNYDYYYNYNSNRYYYSAGNFGKKIYEEQIKLSDAKNNLSKTIFNLSKAEEFNKYKGIFIVKASSSEDRWLSDARIVSISDIGIIAKKSKKGITVFVNDLKTTDAISGAEVSVISSNNQTLFNGVTDGDGVISFTDGGAVMKEFTPRLILVQKGEDFNYLDLMETILETSRFDVGGRKELSENYNIFVYGERNLYRPNETVNLSGVVRDVDFMPVSGLPVHIKVIDPRGKIFGKFHFILNEQGSFELNFKLPEYALTGGYFIETYDGAGILLNSYKINVEEFVPDKIRVNLSKEKESIGASESERINIDAEFLFGQKAAGLKYEAEIKFKPKNFVSKKFKDYSFASSGIKDNLEKAAMNGSLDDNGHAELNYIAPNKINGLNVFGAFAYVSVFDITGRTVNRLIQFDLFPKEYYLGLKSPGYYFGTNEKIQIKAAAVDKNDKPISAFAGNAELVRYEWQTVLKKDYSDRYYYDSEKKEVVVWSKDIQFSDGAADIEFTVHKSGQYQLRLSKQGENEYTGIEFYAYRWGGSASTFEINREGRIEIICDKEIYEPGEKAKILFSTPFAGKMLVTFERESVLNYQYVQVNGKSAEINIPIYDNYLPNVFISTILFRKQSLDSSAPFLVGHGYKSIKVENSSNKISVKINAPEKIKPNSKLTVDVITDAPAGAYISLAAVDEGILQLNNFSSPDIYNYMYSAKELSVESFDLYKLLLPEIVSDKSSPGGDAFAAELKKRINPFTSERFKLFSYWSGLRKTDDNGRARFKIDVPQFNGEARLMAVSYFDNKFGAGDKAVKISDDLIIRPQMPRFLTAGDKPTSSVSVVNTTDSEKEIRLNVKSSSLLKIENGNDIRMTIPANSSLSAGIEIAASDKPGKAEIEFSLRNYSVKKKIDITVRPETPLASVNKSGAIKDSGKKEIKIPQDFYPFNYNAQIILSKFPALDLGGELKSLLKYPYGCLEQTVSKLFPQLYFDELAMLVAPEIYKNGNPVYFVREGIRKIESMQLYNGSFAFWQGGDYTNWWADVYAAHFLLEAKKKNFNINPNIINKALDYLESQLKTKKTVDYYTYKNNFRTVKKIAPKEAIYSLYVLALAGQGDIAAMNYYKSRPHLLTADTKYLLAGSYAVMGKWDSYNKIIDESDNTADKIFDSGVNFDSEIRANALMLSILVDNSPEDERIPLLTDYLGHSKDKIYSAQEKSFVLLSLGKAAGLNSDSDLNIRISSDGKNLSDFNGKNLITQLPYGAESVVLKSSGSGSAYYLLTTEGLRKGKKVRTEDSYLKVRRRYYDYYSGNEITDKIFKRGELVIGRISLEAREFSIDNIVISDLLPACFEIENPRFSASRKAEQEDNVIDIDNLDIRDDRLLLFCSINGREKRYYDYLIRVVSSGEFVLPGISAESMYEKRFYSKNSNSIIKSIK